MERYSLKTFEDLKSAPYNPRRISKQAASALAKSLGDFGDLSGIVFNSRTGHLVTGHQRVDQLRALGARLEGEWISVPSTGEKFRVRVVDWSEMREKTANIVANNQAISGEFTDQVDDLLDEIVSEIGGGDYADLLLDQIADERSEASELKEWDSGDLNIEGMFIFAAPIEMQAKVRDVLEREFPGVNFREEVVYG
jgi:hypothetical protein